MTIFNLHCEEPWFTLIRQGIKPVEGRKNSPSYHKIKANDFINFSNGKDSFLAMVLEVKHYDSIEKYLDDVTLEKALPGIKTIQEGINTYYQWSTKEQIREYGFLGIFIKPV